MRGVSSARDLRPLLALVAVNGAADGALLPLLPTVRGELGLSGLEVAALLSATTVAMLVGAVPAGLLAGREPAWGTPMFPDLRKYARDLKIEDMIRWIGYVDEADKPSLYRMARVFASPSIYEGFGLPILEAMAAGVPVACSSRAALPEVAGEAALYFDPFSVSDMARQISRLALDETLQTSLRQRGRRNLERFSWEATARQTLQAYRTAYPASPAPCSKGLTSHGDP